VKLSVKTQGSRAVTLLSGLFCSYLFVVSAILLIITKRHPIELYGFMNQDIIKNNGPWRVLKLAYYNLRWTTTHDILHHAIIYL